MLLLLVNVGFGQENANTKPAEQSPMGCEQVRTMLDSALVEFQKSDDPKSYLILVFRSGRKDGRKSLNASRMRDTEKHFKMRRVVSRYRLTEMPPTVGLGRADIYVGGRLFGSLFFKPRYRNICEIQKW